MRVDEFHVALARGSTDWGPFLEGLTGGVRLALLTQLAVMELGHRWESGEQPTPAEYAERFPELGPPGSEPVKLVAEFERRRESAGPSAFATQQSNRRPAEIIDAAPTRTVMASGVPKMAQAFAAGVGDAVVAIDQQYQMVRELGRGAFGEVWLARKMPSGIEKAVKILHQPADQDAAQRELRSLELIKNLRHPYLLATEDFWVADNRLYIVTELADISLRRRLIDCKADGHPGIPVDELFGYIHEAADGFDFLHSKLIAHRDVKPDNILIVNGHAKVADFGLARTSETNVAQMSFAGTPAYMAPEVWGGEGGPASDLYGFAMSYVELRQGTTPFKFGKVMEVMQAHLNGNYEFAAFIQEPERAVLRRALAREPADRYPSCLAFVEDLADALGRQVHRKTGAMAIPAARTSVPSSTGVDTNFSIAAPGAPAGSIGVTPPRRSSKKRVAGITVALLVAIAIGTFAVKGCGQRDGNPLPGNRPPDANDASVPNGASAEEGSPVVALADGRRLPQWVIANHQGEAVRFRLIAPGTIPPFYISQSKVWNKLYGSAGPPNVPATRMTANDAAAFAASLGGRLPTPTEWDHAAGLYDRQGLDRPLKAGGMARIKIAEPEPTHGEGAELAENQFDLIDMAGNGREWTAAVLPGFGQAPRIIDGASFGAKDLAILRGRNYTLPTPLTYAILEAEEKDPQTQFAGAASPYTSFRIVLPAP